MKMNTNIRPVITAEMAFRKTSDGGRETPVSYQTFGKRFGCLFLYKEELFNCFILLSEGNQIFPGETVVFPITFLDPKLIIPEIRVGDPFQLKELNIIADGKVLKILDSERATNTLELP